MYFEAGYRLLLGNMSSSLIVWSLLANDLGFRVDVRGPHAPRLLFELAEAPLRIVSAHAHWLCVAFQTATPPSRILHLLTLALRFLIIRQHD